MRIWSISHGIGTTLLGFLWLTTGAIGQSQETAAAAPTLFPTHTWTTTDGKSVNGTLLGVSGGRIRIQLEDGRVVTPQLSQVSAADRQYVARRATRMAANSMRAGWSESGVQITNKASAWAQWVFASNSDITVHALPASADGKPRYQTRSFDWTGGGDLPAETKRDVARLFEGTMTLLRLLPGGLARTTDEAGGRYEIELVSSGTLSQTGNGLRCSYKAAGVVGSGSKAHWDPLFQGEALRRALVNMVLGRAGADYLPAWVVQGLGNYVTAIPQVDGVFLTSRTLTDLKKSCEGNPRNLGSIGVYLKLNAEDWIEEVKIDPEQERTINFASMAMVHYLFTESRDEAKDLESMFNNSTSMGPKWDDYLAKIKAYREKYEALKKRPDVTVKPDGSLELPGDVEIPQMPQKPEDFDPILLYEKHSEIATGGRSAAEFSASVMLGLNDAFERVPPKFKANELSSERDWRGFGGQTIRGSFLGIENKGVFMNAEGKSLRIALENLWSWERELIALQVADWVRAQ